MVDSTPKLQVEVEVEVEVEKRQKLNPSLSAPCQKFTEVLTPVESRAKAGTGNGMNSLKGLVFSLFNR